MVLFRRSTRFDIHKVANGVIRAGVDCGLINTLRPGKELSDVDEPGGIKSSENRTVSQLQVAERDVHILL